MKNVVKCQNNPQRRNSIYETYLRKKVNYRAVARFCALGGGGQCLTQKIFSSRKELFWPSRGVREHIPPELIFKIKGPRLAKNAFPEILARIN